MYIYGAGLEREEWPGSESVGLKRQFFFAVSDDEDLDIRNRSEMKTVGIRYS